MYTCKQVDLNNKFNYHTWTTAQSWTLTWTRTRQMLD